MIWGILGTGALGAYYGARLHHSGETVHFVLRSAIADVQKSGLKVESIHGDFSITQPSIFARAQDLPPCDVLAICTKATANSELLQLPLQKLVRPGGALLLLQNGMGWEEEFADAFPDLTVLGGLAFLCSNQIAPGHIRHLDYGAIRLGSLQQSTPILESIAHSLTQAGIETSIVPSLELARWQKLVWNIPFNGLSVVLQTTTDHIVNHREASQLAYDLMLEVQAAARSRGHEVSDNFINKMMQDTRRMTPYLPSMRLDFDAGRPLEIDAIYRRPIARAFAAGFAMSRTAMLADQLSFLTRSQS